MVSSQIQQRYITLLKFNNSSSSRDISNRTTSKKIFINSKISIMGKPLTLPKIKTNNVEDVAELKPIKLDEIHLDELNKLAKEEELLQVKEWDKETTTTGPA